jgi:hypothetical protein
MYRDLIRAPGVARRSYAQERRQGISRISRNPVFFAWLTHVTRSLGLAKRALLS